MKKKVFITLGTVLVVGLLWLVAWGDFAEWRYSKNLHCEGFQNARQGEICKSIEKSQEYTFTGHAMISAGYWPTFTTATKAWCELSLTENDLLLLDEMQYEGYGHNNLSSGAGTLYSLLDAKINPNPNLYSGSIYDPSSSGYLLKDGCIE